MLLPEYRLDLTLQALRAILPLKHPADAAARAGITATWPAIVSDDIPTSSLRQGERAAVSCGPVTIPLRLFNTLTRDVADFAPTSPPRGGMDSCGPTVYSDQHIGNMRAYVFADTLKRTLTWQGFEVRHVINITDVGHLTSDADEGDDKVEAAARREHRSAWEITERYTGDFKADLGRLRIIEPSIWCKATDHVPQMIRFAAALDAAGCEDIVLLPLYPQYSKTTTGSSLNEWQRRFPGDGRPVSLIPEFYRDELYLDAVIEKVNAALQRFDDPNGVELVFSAHSVPVAVIAAGERIVGDAAHVAHPDPETAAHCQTTISNRR